MSTEPVRGTGESAADVAVTEERLKAAEAFVELDEGATRRFRGALAVVTTTLLVVMSLYHLYAAVDIVPAQVLRPVNVGFLLVIVLPMCTRATRYR